MLFRSPGGHSTIPSQLCSATNKTLGIFPYARLLPLCTPSTLPVSGSLLEEGMWLACIPGIHFVSRDQIGAMFLTQDYMYSIQLCTK